MDKIWIIPISLAIIGYFGIFWTLNLSDMSFDISMDYNTLEAFNRALDEQKDNFNVSIFNHENLGAFCDANTPKGYTLSVWWDGGGSTRDEFQVTCGYSNSDGASKYVYYSISEFYEWITNSKEEAF